MTLIEDFVLSIFKVQKLFSSVIQAFSTKLSKNLNLPYVPRHGVLDDAAVEWDILPPLSDAQGAHWRGRPRT